MTSPDDLARRIARQLPRQPEIAPSVARRLTAIRHAALAHQKLPEVATGPGTLGLLVTGWKRQSAAMLFVLLAGFAYVSFEADQYITNTVEQDTQILADELPFEALLDPEFFDFMKSQSDALEEGLQ